MTLKRVGVSLVAENSQSFLRTIEDGNKAIANFGDAATSAAPRFSKFEQITVGALREVGKVAVNFAASAGKALLGFGADSINVAGNFEATMNKFESVVGPMDQAGLSVQDFSKKFLKLGMDTQFSAQQAGDAAVELAKGGLSTTQIMSGALDATLALAAAGELELAPAATIVAKQLGVWESEAGGATNVVNRLAQAANSSTVNVDDLALGLANVGGVARAAGLSFDETVATVGLIAPGFSSASDAGTSLKAMLAGIQPSTKSATDAFAELGLLTEQGTSKFYDAQGSFVGMTKATELLATATRDLSEADKSRLLRLAFGSDAQRAAIELAKQGAEGYDKFTGSMDKQGSAIDQAAKRNRGFKFAVDQLLGSLETAQIVIGSKLLPAGTALINSFLIPAVNGAMALADGLGVVVKLMELTAIPVLGGLTAAVIAYNFQAGLATLTTFPFGIALQVLAGQALAATGAFVALAAPIALIGVSVAGVGIAWNVYSDKIDQAIAKTKELSTGFQASGKALENYKTIQMDLANMSPTIQANLENQRQIVEKLRMDYDAAARAYYEFGGGEEAKQRLQETGLALQEQSARLVALTNNTRPLIEANKQNNEAMRLSREGLVNFATAADKGQTASQAMAAALRPVGEEAEKLYQELDKLRESGLGLFAKVTQGTVDYQSTIEGLTAAHTAKMTELRATGNAQQIAEQEASYATQMETAAISYAEQEAAQLASLGRMLIAYTETQGRLNGVTQENINKMTAKIADGYGVMVSETDRSFGAMTGSIDAWAANGGQMSDQLVTDLLATGATAVDTQQRMDLLAKEYTAELIQNFKDGKIDADELSAALSRIPARVNSEVRIHTSYTESGNGPPVGANYGGNRNAVEARAGGGPISAGKPYLVGERGPEFIFPRKPGWVLDADETARLMSPFSRSGITGQPIINGLTDSIYRASPMLESAITNTVGTAMQAGNTTVRMGIQTIGRTTQDIFNHTASQIEANQGLQHAIGTILNQAMDLGEGITHAGSSAIQSAMQALIGNAQSGVGQIAGLMSQASSMAANLSAMISAPAQGYSIQPVAARGGIFGGGNIDNSIHNGPTYAPVYNSPAPPPAMSYATLNAMAGV